MVLPYSILFSSMLFLSTLFIPFSSYWLLTWMALEMNLMSFIPMMSLSSSYQEMESSIKYFLAQALGSSMMISSIMLMTSNNNSHYILLMLKLFLLLSLLLKIGIAPLHFWFPSVMAGLAWPMVLILSSWQKIGPLMILMSMTIMPPFTLLLTIATFSTLIGGWGGINQTQLRPLLAYSSIGHMGWMLAGLTISQSFSLIYMMFYMMILIPMIIIMFKLNMSSTLMNNTKLSMLMMSSLLIMFLSLGGLPPLLGFFPKWALILLISPMNTLLPLMLMITGSLMNIFYYISLFIPMFMSLTNQKMINPLTKQVNTMVIVSTMATLSTFSLMLMYALTIFNQP